MKNFNNFENNGLIEYQIWQNGVFQSSEFKFIKNFDV